MRLAAQNTPHIRRIYILQPILSLANVRYPPEADAPGAFFALFWAKDNNPSLVDRIHADMWEHDLIKHYKGLFHVNPGGFTYTEGWSELLKRYTESQNENARIREMDALRKEVEMLKSQN